MKPHYLDRSNTNNKSLSLDQFSGSNFLKIWHYHAELELCYIKKSKGNLFVGDAIRRFKKGELILLGKNLPHMWLNSDKYFKETVEDQAESITVHFKEEILGKDEALAEFKDIIQLVQEARLGLKFKIENTDIYNLLEQMSDLGAFEQVLQLFKILQLLTREERETIVSSGFRHMEHMQSKNNLDKVYAFIYDNFHNPIRLENIAQIANMNPSAFSRFFKKVNNKTLVTYINEIRVGYACKLLLEKTNTISEICYESGFNNVSNFNRQFKNIKGVTPKEYVKQRSVLN